MYVEIISQIQTLLENVVIQEVADGEDKTLEVIPHPLEKGEEPNSYPFIVFYPNDYTNEFSSTQTNFKNLKFRAVLTINAENISNKELFTFTLPRAADRVIQEIDEQWDMGRIDGRQVWIRTDIGSWNVEQSEIGRMAYVIMDLLVKLQTNN